MAKGKYQQWLVPESLERITNWAANGLTIAEMAKSMSVGERTFYEWLERYPQFSQAIKRGRGMSCEVIENALFKRAVGYEVQETDVVEEFTGELRDGKPANGVVKRRETTRTRHLPPDVAAVIFYLKNRAPERYSDRRVIEQAAAVPTVVLGVEPGRAQDG
jgi:hypothetical protein